MLERRLSTIDAIQLGKEVFSRDATKHLSPPQLSQVNAGMSASASPYVDNEGWRALLSEEQRKQLEKRAVDFSQSPSCKRVPNAIMYVLRLENMAMVMGNNEMNNKDINDNNQWLSCIPEEQQDMRVEFLVVLIFTDTGEVIPHWRTSW